MKAARASFPLSIGIMLLFITVAAGETVQTPERLSAEEIMERHYNAFYAPADDSRIEASLVLYDRDGNGRSRRLAIWRLDLNPEGTRQKVLIYFREPPDIRRLTIMVWKHPDRDDDRWMFIPAVNLVRRLSARDYSQSFVGSDFTYEDGTGRDISADTHRFLREEEIDGAMSYVVESTPRSKASWSRHITWVDKQTFLPHRQEFYNARGELERVFTGGPVEMVRANGSSEAFPTMMERKMENVLTGHYSVFTFLSIGYNVGIEEGDFSERSLRRPPKKWVE